MDNLPNSEMKSREQILEASRQRAKKHYEKNKEAKKARSKEAYYKNKNEILAVIRDRYQNEIREAVEGKCNIPLSHDYKYRQCPYCKHYSHLIYRTFIAPNGDMLQRPDCPYCRSGKAKVIFALSQVTL